MNEVKIKRVKWDREKLIASAALYGSKKEWKKGDYNAYNAAQRNGWLDDEDITRHMKAQLIYWTKPMLIASAAPYTSKLAWNKGDSKAYQAAQRNGWLDDPQITGHMEDSYTTWTKPKLIASAALYTNKSAWQTGDSKAYDAAQRNGWLDDEDITGHMEGNIKWTKPKLIASAALYTNKSAWQTGDSKAYDAAQRNGWLDDPQITGHMEAGSGSDNDVIYIWKVVDQHHQGIPVYKIGTTSARLDDQRIQSVAKSMGFDFELVILAKVLEKATDIETALLKLGVNPQYSGFDGATEFRALDDTDLAYALSIITANIDIKHKPKSRAHLTLVA